MAAATLPRVNAALRAAGIDAELQKGRGYFYFTGPAVEGAYSTSVVVYRISALTVEEWVEEARTLTDKEVD